MKTSETINELAEALGKAQSEMTGAKKESANPFFKSKYSDLTSVMEAISEPFANNNLSFVQGAEADELRVAITTRIMHKSGQWIEATTILPPTKNDTQGWGSAISYGRRYGLQSLAGVPSVDDDGNAAVTAASKPKSKQKIEEIRTAIANSTTMEQLSAVWGELDSDQMRFFAKDKDAAKSKFNLGEK